MEKIKKSQDEIKNLEKNMWLEEQSRIHGERVRSEG